MSTKISLFVFTFLLKLPNKFPNYFNRYYPKENKIIQDVFLYH